MIFHIKICIPLLALTCGIIGCVSTNMVTTRDQYAEINALGKEYRATITVQVDSATAYDFQGDYTAVGSDSVRWINPCTGLARSEATSRLLRVRFAKSLKGAFEGLAFGATPGIVIAVVGGGAIGGFWIVVGGIAGTVIGAVNGHSTDYVFRAP